MLRCFEVQQRLVEVCGVSFGVGDGELVAFHLASLGRLQAGMRTLANGSIALNVLVMNLVKLLELLFVFLCLCCNFSSAINQARGHDSCA